MIPMKTFQFKKVDAFTQGLSSGNPAGCVVVKDIQDINEAEMQQIAAELKGFVSEVVYLFPEPDGYLLRYYSSECEVDFCGHGTIAMMVQYIKDNPELRFKAELQIRVKDQRLLVKNQIPEDDSVYIMAPAPIYRNLQLSADEIAGALGIPEAEIDPDHQPDLVNGGLNTLIVPIRGLQNCVSIRPDQFSLRDFCLQHEIDIILVFCGETSQGRSHACASTGYRTRVFAPKFGYLEDPATGSGNSAFGYYLLKTKMWDGARLAIEQGVSLDHPNIINLQTLLFNSRTRVLFGGAATVRFAGEYYLQGS